MYGLFTYMKGETWPHEQGDNVCFNYRIYRCLVALPALPANFTYKSTIHVVGKYTDPRPMDHGIELDASFPWVPIDDTSINQVWPPQRFRFRMGSPTPNVIVLVVTGMGPHPIAARQQVNGSGTFDEILSNHSPGFTMSRVTSPKFLGAVWKVEFRLSTHVTRWAPTIRLSFLNGVLGSTWICKRWFFTDCTMVNHH